MNHELKQKYGRRGEDAACAALEGKGFAVIERNARAGGGELDLICAGGGIIVFAEVKARSTAAFGAPSLAVNRAKRARTVRAAECWLAEHPEYAALQPRFDVVEVYLNTGKYHHIEAAFIKE